MKDLETYIATVIGVLGFSLLYYVLCKLFNRYK